METENKIDTLLADLRLVDEQHVYVQDLRLDQRMILRIAIEVLSKVSLIVLYDPFTTFTPSMMMNVRNDNDNYDDNNYNNYIIFVMMTRFLHT